MNRTLRTLLVTSLAAAALTGVLATPVKAKTATEAQMVSEVVQYINGERARRGVAQLPSSTRLNDEAQAWAEYMPSGCNGNICHDPNTGDAEIITRVGNGYSSQAVLSWMKSTAGHRDVLLYEGMTAVGVGVYCDSAGRAWAVARFTGSGRWGATPQDPINTESGTGSHCPDATPTTTQPSSTPPTQPPGTSPPVTQRPQVTTPTTARSGAATTTPRPDGTPATPQPPEGPQPRGSVRADPPAPPVPVPELAAETQSRASSVFDLLRPLGCLGVSRYAITDPVGATCAS